MQKIGRLQSGATLPVIAAEWWSLTTDADYLKAYVSRRDLWWLLLPLPYLVDALANREVTEIVVLDSCAAMMLLMASFLPSNMIWADFVIGAVEASRMVIGNIVVPGAWSPFAAPSLMICFSMAFAGIHSSVLAAFALVAAVADMIAANPGFEEAAVMHTLACVYVVVSAAIMERRLCGQLVGPAAGSTGYQPLGLPSFGHEGTASRILGGEVYYPVHDDPAMSLPVYHPVSDCEEGAPAEHLGGHPHLHPSALGPERHQQDEEQGCAMPPSVGSVATSPRALDSASPAAEELLESPSRMVREVDGASPAVDELLASESRMMEAEASLMRSPELSDLKGALSSMQDSVESLNRSGVLAYNRQDVTYDDELQLTSGTGGPAGGSEPSPIMSVSSPTQPATSHQAVELGGFKTEAFNDLFRPNAQLMVNDQPTWWSKQGWFLFYNAHRRTWCIAKGSSLDRVRAGKSHGNAWSPEGYDLLSGPALEPPRGWKEWDAEARQWVSRPGSGLRSPPRPLEEARSPGAPERGRLHRPEVHRSPRPVHLGPAASPERPAPPLPPPAEPPAGEAPLGSWSPPSPPHAPHGELDAAQRPGGRLW